MVLTHKLRIVFLSCLVTAAGMAQSVKPSVKILLPERTRLLQGQLVDLVLEVRNADSVKNLKVMAGGIDLTSRFSAPWAPRAG